MSDELNKILKSLKENGLTKQYICPECHRRHNITSKIGMEHYKKYRGMIVFIGRTGVY